MRGTGNPFECRWLPIRRYESFSSVESFLTRGEIRPTSEEDPQKIRKNFLSDPSPKKGETRIFSEVSQMVRAFSTRSSSPGKLWKIDFTSLPARIFFPYGCPKYSSHPPQCSL